MGVVVVVGRVKCFLIEEDMVFSIEKEGKREKVRS